MSIGILTAAIPLQSFFLILRRATVGEEGPMIYVQPELEVIRE